MYQFFAFFSVLCLVSITSSIKVRINHGVLQGSRLVTSSGREVFSFLGIPYAMPPLGKYRFDEPKPIWNWNETWQALQFRSDCIQYNTFVPDTSQRITGNEDCLYLNVFTPSKSQFSDLPVLVYFHGGAFMFGSGKDYNPKFFYDNHYDIVHVSVNYRLGPFGFLSTQDGTVPGNNGLKDQVFALKWVHENIKFFGGNKNRVTIAGNSAGAASVHFHYFSPLSRELFAQGISSSGSALLSMALIKDPLQKAISLANLVGCPTNSTDIMITCLKNTSSQQILQKIPLMLAFLPFNPSSPFGPVIEPISKRAFLSEHPYQLMIQGKISDRPWLTGVTSEEGLYPAALFINRKESLTVLNKNWSQIALHLLDFHCTSESNHTIKDRSSSIKKFYFKDEDISEKTKDNLIQMIGERLFKADSAFAARIQASVKKSPVYFYTFTYRGKVSLSHLLSQSETYLGVSHFDDIYYVFALPESLQLVNEEDIRVIQTMTNIWASFVITGNPPLNLKWNPVSRKSALTGETRTLVIHSHKNMSVTSVSNFANFRFWQSLR